MWTGPDRCRLVAVTERIPGEHTPFDSAAGHVVKDEIDEAGIGVEKIAFGFVTPNVRSEVSAHGAGYVLLAGNAALRAWRPDLSTRHCHGRPMLLEPDLGDEGLIGFPVFHPEAYWRTSRWRQLLHDELLVLKDVALDRPHWADFCPVTCVKCRSLRSHTDANGVVYCAFHWPSRGVI